MAFPLRLKKTGQCLQARNDVEEEDGAAAEERILLLQMDMSTLVRGDEAEAAFHLVDAVADTGKAQAAVVDTLQRKARL